MSSVFAGGDPFRAELHLTNTVGSGADDLFMRYVPDAVGRVASIDWKTDPAIGSPWVDLVDYTHEGQAIRTRKTTQALGIAQGATPFDFTTTYDYDDYGRMSRIEHSYDPQTAYYDFVYDDASNLVKEGYIKQGVGVGDRFAYDEHHRLLDAWMGSDQQHYDEADPNSGIGTFINKLTYNLDAANNRDDVVKDGVTTDYTIESNSNRYSQIGSVALAHDSRGNTHFNGDCYLVFDALNRLSEVYKLVPQSLPSSAAATQGGQESKTTFAVSDLSALESARNQILQRMVPRAATLLHLPNDPGVKADSREGLSPTVATATTTDSSGQQSQSSVTFEMVAFYLYDPMNRRVTRWVRDDASYYYAYDGWQEVQRYGVGATATYIQSARGEQLDELLAYRAKDGASNWVNRYVAEGGAHCPMRVLDEAGVEVEIQEYDAYGQATYWASSQSGGATSVEMAYGWRMFVMDPETGLGYVRNRYYSPSLGRFISQDPLGVDGDSATWLNSCNYGSANPLTQSDPFGLQLAFMEPVGTGTVLAAEAVVAATAAAAEGGLAAAATAGGMAAGPALAVALSSLHASAIEESIDEMLRRLPPPRKPISGLKRWWVVYAKLDRDLCQTYVGSTIRTDLTAAGAVRQRMLDGHKWDTPPLQFTENIVLTSFSIPIEWNSPEFETLMQWTLEGAEQAWIMEAESIGEGTNQNNVRGFGRRKSGGKAARAKLKAAEAVFQMPGVDYMNDRRAPRGNRGPESPGEPKSYRDTLIISLLISGSHDELVFVCVPSLASKSGQSGEARVVVFSLAKAS